MFRTTRRALALVMLAAPLPAQQAVDSAYTAKIKEHLQDPRITTELVDHLPASTTVPTPLKFLGRIVGTPGELTYARDIYRYFDALDAASDRIKVWRIGKTEEGRDMIVAAIADEETIRDLDRYKSTLASLTDPRKTSEPDARRLIPAAKPIYWLTSGLHSPETGGPETLMELAYRLIVTESPLTQNIRKNVITFITPVLEVDGREKQVDTYYYNKKRDSTQGRLPLMYWGKYVAHDNNRDGMGQFLALTKNASRFFLEWHPTIMHDLHESVSYLYASTGTGPYNESIDPITVDEWWMLAKNDVMELTRRGVPGAWTYGFYDGWVPNYLFYVAHAHNATGRFYEVQTYGPDNNPNLRVQSTSTSREWFRPNPPLPSIKWGPRNHVNISQSGVLFALNHVAKNREMYVENYWLKNKRAYEKGKNGAPFAWVIPASQRRKADAADAVNSLRFQGVEFHRASAAFSAGGVEVKPGDYIIRADQPYRTLADMYFSFQRYAVGNPRPYDDTGWTFQLMRNLVISPVADKAILEKPMTLVTSDVRAEGGVSGSGPALIVDHTTDNNLVSFRYRFPKVRMLAAEEDFSAAGRTFRAGAFLIPNADRARLEPVLQELGLSGFAVAALPTVKSHELDLPRIGYVHAWHRTQDEGWVRAALDTYGVPYTYFADQKLREGNLRAKYDVIIYPHVGGSAQSQVNGIPRLGPTPMPYRKTDATPNLGTLDQSDDIRGGMGVEGLFELYKFVQQGGTLITEGSTAAIFPEYKFTNGITVENPQQLFARGSIFRGRIVDKKSPIVYGYEGGELPVYFNQDPVMNAGMPGGAPIAAANVQIAGVGQNITPMLTRQQLAEWEGNGAVAQQGDSARARADSAAPAGGGGGFGAQQDTTNRPRIVMQFPAKEGDMLLSGTLAGGQLLANRAQILDAPLGQGHVVMFAIRPFWRWQTQGTFMLGFNTILNWNDLNSGKGAAAAPSVRANGQE
jgi:zinc carboxypeptidase